MRTMWKGWLGILSMFAIYGLTLLTIACVFGIVCGVAVALAHYTVKIL